jgi:4-diphosphocytidyl-2-C-methyl-D-erythritol kinase
MKISSHAKINLFLIVEGKRNDGYHDIKTLFCRIGLHDTLLLDLTRQGRGIEILCSNPEIPIDETNIAYKAASTFFENLEKDDYPSNDGLRIVIKKRIPVGAGLGGGSSNAANVLSGLNKMYGRPFSNKKIMEMAIKTGADVPFFIFRKPAIATGIGEKLKSFKGLNPFKVILVFPGKSVSTNMVYKNLNLRLTKCKQKLNCLYFEKNAFIPEHHLCNDLESVTESICPEIKIIKARLLELGSVGSLMTGSGPTVFGLFSDSLKAEYAYYELLKNTGWEVFLTDLLVS